MKNILHLQFTINSKEKGYKSPDMLGNFILLIRNRLGDNWEVIYSPYETSVYSEEYKLYNFDVRQLSKKEFLDIIKIKL
jgi:hypothetical protein